MRIISLIVLVGFISCESNKSDNTNFPQVSQSEIEAVKQGETESHLLAPHLLELNNVDYFIPNEVYINVDKLLSFVLSYSKKENKKESIQIFRESFDLKLEALNISADNVDGETHSVFTDFCSGLMERKEAIQENLSEDEIAVSVDELVQYLSEFYTLFPKRED